jgi:hypothetical protein
MNNFDAAIALSKFQSLHYQDADNDGVLVDTQSLECNEAVVAGDDFTSFINAKPTKLTNNQSPIEWWCVPAQRMAYPVLSRLGIDVLSAFSMSAESERVFSGCRRTVTWQRSRLSSDIISYSKCSKAWQCSGVAAIPLITSVSNDNSDVVLEQAK